MDKLDLLEEIHDLKRRNEELQKQLNAAHAGLLAVKALIDDSHGVAGLHLNGDTAAWSDLRTGGKFEDWLMEFDFALAQAEEHPATHEKRPENASRG